MTQRQHEQTLNVWFAEALKGFVLDANPEVIHPGNRRIDIEVLIGPPEVKIAVEAEHGQSRAKQREAIKDADARLKQNLADCSVAVCYPDNTTRETLPNAALMWTVRDGIGVAENWTSGGIEQLVAVIRRLPDQLGEPDAVAKTLSDRLDNAVRSLDSEQMQMLGRALDLPGWLRKSGKVKASHASNAHWDRAAKRALLVVATAVMFHSRLDSHLPGLRPEYDNRLQGDDTAFTGDWPPAMAHQCTYSDAPISAFYEAWNLILALDYKPIFETACAALQSCPPNHTFAEAIRQTADAALKVTQRISSLRHDLLGRIFHTVLDTARYDGSFYTTTAAATLLATLAIRPDFCDWHDPDAIKRLRITDPACGTGTLLMAAAERIRDIAPQTKDNDDLARALIEEVFSGYDVNLTATHMTATTLGLLSPTTRFQNMKIGRVFYGVDDGTARIGSLEFLEHQAKLISWPNAGQVVAQVDTDEQMVQPEPADLVIMNPPFTQHDLRYQQFDDEEKWEMRNREKELFANRPVHLSSIGNAFLVLANYIRKIDGSTIAAVLPMATATHTTSQGIRQFLARNFHIETIVTSHDPERIYFSENTDIGEILMICRVWSGANESKPPTRVVNLMINPEAPADAIAIAAAIENGTVESQAYGTVQEWPFTRISNSDWGAVQFFSPYLCDQFVALKQGSFFSVRSFESVASMGSANIRPTISRTDIPAAEGMVALWDHKTNVTQSMSAKVDSYAVAKRGKEAYARSLWAKRGRFMLPTRIRLNTVRMLSVRVNTPALGSAWVPCRPDKIGIDVELLEKSICVYFNSSIGILAMLGNRSNKTPSYPQFSMDDLNKLFVPDLAALGDDSLRILASAYESHCDRTLLPLPQMVVDPVRAALDDAVCSALGIDTEEVATIRRHISAEPSVTGERYRGLRV